MKNAVKKKACILQLLFPNKQMCLKNKLSEHWKNLKILCSKNKHFAGGIKWSKVKNSHSLNFESLLVILSLMN